MISKFELGKVYMTNTINHDFLNDLEFNHEIYQCMFRYISGDWGELDVCDKLSNNQSKENGDDIIMGVYKTSHGPINIVTSINRANTTICYPDEN